MIDLHIHSTYSDGTENVLEILKKAQELKLDTISITDHETCDAYKELRKINIKEFYSGEIITGIELKSHYKDKIIDILGYNIDYTKMNTYLKECYKEVSREKIQEKQLEEFYRYGNEYGLILKPIKELEWDKKKDWGSMVFYRELKAHEENKLKVPEDLWESVKNFKRNYYHIKGKMFYTNMSNYYPNLDKILEIIHNSGGIAFVAHIHEYSWMEDKILELNEIIKDFNIDGIECYYSNFTEDQISELIDYCHKNNLLISGGSDYHGNNKPEISLGIGKGNLKVPTNIIDNWNNVKKLHCV